LDELSGRTYLSPGDQRLERQLKKEKLAAKDQIVRVRAESG
jgi:hypothetical protein